MIGITRTRHFDQRFQQRSMNEAVIWALLHYGESCSSCRGVEKLIFTRGALAEIRSDHGPGLFKMCQKLRNTYLVVAGGDTLVTVAHRHHKAASFGGRALQ